MGKVIQFPNKKTVKRENAPREDWDKNLEKEYIDLYCLYHILYEFKDDDFTSQQTREEILQCCQTASSLKIIDSTEV